MQAFLPVIFSTDKRPGVIPAVFVFKIPAVFVFKPLGSFGSANSPRRDPSEEAVKP
jgi:hypothetical protein